MTRSRSEILLRRTRSSMKPFKKDIRYNSSVKDLRLKRVFIDRDTKIETNGTKDDAEKNRSGGSEDDLMAVDGAGVSEELKLENAEENNLPEREFDRERGVTVPEEMNFGDLSNNKPAIPPCPRSKLLENPSSVSYKKLLPYLKDLSKDGSSGIQIRQPRINPSNTNKTVLSNFNELSKFDGVKGWLSGGTNSCNLLENKMGLSSSLRSRIVGNPNSISYKRLLPYLNDLAKDGSSGIEIPHFHNHSLRAGNITRETPLPFNSSSREQNNSVTLGDTLMVDTVVNCNLEEIPVIENSGPNSHDEIAQMPIYDEFNNKQMDEINVEDKKGSNEEPNKGDIEIFKVVDKCSEDIVQGTLPDADLAEKCSEDTVHGMSPDADLAKTALPPRPRSKLVENTSSVSYKRLLPYLKDLSKDGSSGIQICQPRINPSNTDKSMLSNFNELSKFDGVKAAWVSGETNSSNFSENKMGLSSSSRSRIVSNPNSVSYKRLLPYLKDLAMDGSSGIEIPHFHNHSLKAENITRDTPLPFNSSFSEQNDSVTLGDTLMVDTVVNCNLEEIPVVENSGPNSYDETAQMPIYDEFNDKQVDEINVEDEKGSNEELGKSDIEILKVVDKCSEYIVQITPPDVDLADKCSEDIVHGMPSDADLDNKCSEDSVHGTPPDTDLANKLHAMEVRSQTTIMEPGLNIASKKFFKLVSCSRSKLHHSPSSFSYRRLLPYLTDLVKNQPYGMEIIHNQNPAAIAEEILGERSTLSTDVPLSMQTSHSEPLIGFSNSCLRQDDDMDVSHVEESLGFDSQGYIHSCNSSKVEILSTKNDTHKEKLAFEFDMLCKSCSSTTTTNDLSLEEQSGSIMEFNRKHNERVSKLETVNDNGGNQALAPKKSILKRQSTGCKGICLCLDCTSYRIHAERAYEFSRKQMAGADEVVERLMKELACLRKIMERSAVSTVDGTESYTVLKAHQEQVMGVCQRAFKVEEQAKSYMMQMFTDLNNHCKLPGPRVTFSDKLQERTIL